MIFIASMIMHFLISTTRLAGLSVFETNLTLYVLLIQAGLVMYFQSKDSFNLGLFRYTDETKMQMLMSFKAFLLVFLGLKSYGTADVFEFDLKEIHNNVNIRLTEGLKPFIG